jgi:hypothetical protein
LNLWRHVQKRKDDVNLLDIGLKLMHKEDLCSLILYIPAKIKSSELIDLSPFLQDETTASAVFNEL